MKKKLALFLCLMLLVLEGINIMPLQTAAADSAMDVNDLVPMEELVGWATVPGEGLERVTGGGDAKPQIVKDLAELKELAGDDIPRVLVISGKIVTGSGGVRVGSNKTIVGMDENAMIRGILKISGESNIIVSNLSIKGFWPMPGSGDCVEVRNSHHIWFNHLSLWNSYDGNMDITIGSDYITVSWCKFWYTNNSNDGEEPEQNHRLSNLIGSGTGHDDTDMDKLRVTYHHNWFAENLDQRMPRVMYGRVHVYNNYYTAEGNNYCIGADCYASLLVENNYFKKVNNPHKFSYGVGLPACIVARGNIYDNTRGSRDTGQGSDIGGYAVPFETTVYDYYLSPTEEVPELVEAYAGPQDMSDNNTFRELLKEASWIKGQEDVLPDREPIEEEEEILVNDNPITYDKETDTYTYHGQNSDGTNGFYTLENPFAGKDYSETPVYESGNPVWTKGATISYWVKVPENVTDFPVLNFNLKERQMERSGLSNYNLCKNISYTDGSYDLGTRVIYVDQEGKEYIALEGYGSNVRANPAYPKEGYYYVTDRGGAYRVYKKGTDPKVDANWTYLNYIGTGLYEEYANRYWEEGGENSKIKEADIKGSFSLYASGSFGYRQDNWTGLQQNPNLPTYGSVIEAHTTNQFYYWGNGGYYSLRGSGLKSPTMAEKDQWHFVTVVIQNDWVQYYMDGVKITTDYLNWWSKEIESDTAGDSFHLGYGHRMNPKGYNPPAIYQTGKTILEFISDEDTVLTIGGTGYCASNLSQDIMLTESGAQVKDVRFYYSAVSSNCILEDRIDLSKGNTGVEAPDKTTTRVTLSFESDGGSKEEDIQVLSGKEAGKLPLPEKEGYIFAGWYTDHEVQTEQTEFTAKSVAAQNMTLYAKWEDYSAELSFESNGGSSVESKRVTWNQAVGDLPIPAREGHIFAGWYEDSTLQQPFTSESRILEDRTIYAKWEKAPLFLYFDPMGGELSSPDGSSLNQMTVFWDEPVGRLPIPKKAGYLFKGWFLDEECTIGFTSGSRIREETTVYAKWEEITGVVIAFEINGGDFIPAEQVSPGGTLDSLPLPVRRDHIFTGWYEDSQFTSKFTVNTPINGNITLYARWEKKGDMNLDGTINANDALLILKYAAKMITDENITSLQKQLGDVVGSEESLDANDALAILKRAANIIQGFDER